MKLKKKIGLLLFLVLLIAAIIFLLPQNKLLLSLYSNYIYYPCQSFRMLIFGVIPFSIGDVLYVLAGAWLLLTLLRWAYYLSKFGAYKERLAASLLNAVNTMLAGYLLFILGWGANYYKHPLSEYWKLQPGSVGKTRAAQRAADSIAMVSFEQLLVSRLNQYAPRYHDLPLHDINERARAYYRVYSNSKLKQHGLGIKPTLFGFFMERMAVEGYYNPFTGEGQVNKGLSAFLLPFTICHEMAHQAGIAAEDDANLMAYAIATAAPDDAFNYSAYLNLWFYTHSRVYRRDSAMAKRFEAQLNPLTTAHIDTLEQISKKYHHEVAHYSAEIYDNYLRMQNQKDGIRSYGNVAYSAWLLEQKRRVAGVGIIRIP